MNSSVLRDSAKGSPDPRREDSGQYSRSALREVIAASPWFRGAPEGALDTLAESARVKRYKKDRHLWTVGESHTEVFVVLSGRVRLYSTGYRGKEYALDDRGEGAWLGVSCISDNTERDFSARALVASDLLVLHRQAILDVGRDWPRLYENLFSHVVANSRGLYALLSGVLFYPLRARVGLRLMQFVGEYGRELEEGVLIDIKVSQNDLASLAGGSRQRINMILKDWEERGLLEVRGERLLIRDLEAFGAELQPFDYRL